MATVNQADRIEPLRDTELTPEEETLLMRLGVFNKMRWVAILGVIVVAEVARYVFDIGFDVLPVYIICLFMALYNLVLMRQMKNLQNLPPEQIVPRVRQHTYSHIVLDMLTLTILLHFTGGVENPFIFFFVFHIILASIGLSYRVVYILSAMAVAMVGLMVGLEYADVIPHVNLEGFILPTRYQDASRVLAVMVALAVLLFVTTYVTTAIAGELRKRQRQIVALRDDLLEEKTSELERASGEIVQLEEERNKFLSFISIAAHDLKAPLTAIQGFLWVMLDGFAGEISDKQRNMLERSSRRITELLSLISDLLDIPRIETGQVVHEMKEISLRQVIRNSLEGQRDLAKDKGIKVKVEMPEGLPHIRGSASRLQQVITNLVNNAVNYTAEGTITIRVSEQAKDILVEVEDTGIGIPAGDMPHLFEDFFRASNVEAKKGTGLGLSITRRIVQAHGGQIWVESPCPASETGSRFSLTLPKMSKTRRKHHR